MTSQITFGDSYTQPGKEIHRLSQIRRYKDSTNSY